MYSLGHPYSPGLPTFGTPPALPHRDLKLIKLDERFSGTARLRRFPERSQATLINGAGLAAVLLLTGKHGCS
jgi:hypothetical protein